MQNGRRTCLHTPLVPPAHRHVALLLAVACCVYTRMFVRSNPKMRCSKVKLIAVLAATLRNSQTASC